MTRSCSGRDPSPVASRARQLLVAGIGAVLLIGLLAAGAPNASTTSPESGANSRSAIVVQRDATVAIGTSNTARSHRLVVAGAFFSIIGLAAIAAGRMAARRQQTPSHRGGTLRARLRAPPSSLVLAH
jgi:hypothetical protein